MSRSATRWLHTSRDAEENGGIPRITHAGQSTAPRPVADRDMHPKPAHPEPAHPLQIVTTSPSPGQPPPHPHQPRRQTARTQPGTPAAHTTKRQPLAKDGVGRPGGERQMRRPAAAKDGVGPPRAKFLGISQVEVGGPPRSGQLYEQCRRTERAARVGEPSDRFDFRDGSGLREPAASALAKEGAPGREMGYSLRSSPSLTRGPRAGENRSEGLAASPAALESAASSQARLPPGQLTPAAGARPTRQG